MTRRVGPTMRLAASVAGVLLAASTAQAIPSIAIKWRSTGTATIASPAHSSTQIADIVITTVTQTVHGIFISIEFDNVELTAIAANEIAHVGLPGMGNEFTPRNNRHDDRQRGRPGHVLRSTYSSNGHGGWACSHAGIGHVPHRGRGGLLR